MKFISTLIIGLLTSQLGFAQISEPLNEGWQDMSATYSVPVSDELKAYSQFPLGDFRVRVRDGIREMKYTLPLELTGEPTEVSVSEGYEEESDVLCDTASCSVRYPNLLLDASKVSDFLSSQHLSPAEFDGRMQVFSDFAHDPVGIIYFSETY